MHPFSGLEDLTEELSAQISDQCPDNIFQHGGQVQKSNMAESYRKILNSGKVQIQHGGQVQKSEMADMYRNPPWWTVQKSKMVHR